MQGNTEPRTKKARDPWEKARAVIERVKRRSGQMADGFWDLLAEDFSSPRILAARRIYTAFLFCLMLFFLTLAACGRYPLSVYPIPAAFAAVGGSFRTFRGGKKKESSVPAILFLGSALLSGLFLPQGVLFVFVLTVTILLRAVFTGGAFDEPCLIRCGIAFSSSLLLAVWETLLSPRTDSFLRCLSQAGLSGVFCAAISGAYLYFGARDGKTAKMKNGVLLRFFRPERTAYLDVACAGVLFCVLYAARDISVFGISPSLTAAALCGLYAAKQRGPICGAFIGLFAGLGAGGDAAAIPTCLLALTSAFFFARSTALALSVSFVFSGFYLLYFLPASSFALYAADLFLGALFYYPLDLLLRRARRAHPALPAPPRHSPRALSALSRRLSALSTAFSSLSEVFYMATDRSLAPDCQKAAEFVREATGRVCVRCHASSDCWERNYGLTRSALANLSVVLSEKKKVSPEDLEPYFKSRCEKSTALCAEINRRFAAACGGVEAKDVPASLLCGEYASVAKLLRFSAAEETRTRRQNEEATAAACRALQKLGLLYQSVRVTGGRALCVEVTGLCLPQLPISASELVRALSEEIGVSFEEPEFLPPLDHATMRLRRARAVRLFAARAVRAKDDHDISGDTTGFFESEEEYFYSLICDGMGSGREAAFTSRLASIFIEKLLTFSEEKGVTLEMLNRFLLSQDEERFSTVDLLEVDFYTGKANFIKAGAPPSFIKRGSGLYRVASDTPPAGILHTLSAEQTSLSLCDGDQVVMFSDGIADSADSSSWFAETLAFAPEKDADDLAKYLIRKAREHNGGKIPDDMSVTVLNVRSA